MSLAFSALLLAILLLPGIVFRYAYLRSDSLRKTVDVSLLSELVFLLIPTLAFHSLGYFLLRSGAHFGISRSPSVSTLYALLSGQPLGTNELVAVELGFIGFVAYTLTLCAVAGIWGTWLQRISLRRAWDEQFKVLRIYNDWDKYFTGHVLARDPLRRFDYVQVDVVVQSGDGDILYTGALSNYSLNQQQGIDRIFLEAVYRRRLADDLPLDITALNDMLPATKDEDPRYYNMPGDYLVVPFSQVRNLNISYRKFEQFAE